MPRRIIIHDHAQARTVHAIAAELGVAVTLQSPDGAAAYLGPTYFQGLDVVLDCGDAPGHALAALRAGVRRIRLRAAPEVLARVADIAGQLGAELHQNDGPVLDLGRVPPGRWAVACREWLGPSD